VAEERVLRDQLLRDLVGVADGRDRGACRAPET
jgi:hypothetical protein